MIQIIMLVCAVIMFFSPKSIFKEEKLKPGQTIETQYKKFHKISTIFLIICIILVILEFLG